MKKMKSRTKENMAFMFLILLLLAETTWILSWRTYRATEAAKIQQQIELARSEYVRAFHLAK